MMWQDLVFLVGSMTSVMFLYPTLRDTASQVPRATSIPSMIIGGAYSFTFFTLGMTFSATGAFAACTMWSLIAAFRAPDSESYLEDTPMEGWFPGLTERSRQLFGQTPQPSTATETADEFEVASNSD